MKCSSVSFAIVNSIPIIGDVTSAVALCPSGREERLALVAGAIRSILTLAACIVVVTVPFFSFLIIPFFLALSVSSGILAFSRGVSSDSLGALIGYTMPTAVKGILMITMRASFPGVSIGFQILEVVYSLGNLCCCSEPVVADPGIYEVDLYLPDSDPQIEGQPHRLEPEWEPDQPGAPLRARFGQLEGAPS